MIEIRNTSVTYRGGVKALQNIDLTIGDGEFVVIVGLSGAGKSTLLRALNGLVPVTEGSIKIDGREVVGASSRELREIRSEIGMIFQTFNLVLRTSVLNNVLMGRLSKVPLWRSTLGIWPDEHKEVAFQSLERVGIVEKTYVRASDLSGGQQQRVGIARGEMGITTLINLHFLDLARAYGERMIGLREGKLIYDGNIADVDDRTFREIYGRAITPDDIKESQQ